MSRLLALLIVLSAVVGCDRSASRDPSAAELDPEQRRAAAEKNLADEQAALVQLERQSRDELDALKASVGELNTATAAQIAEFKSRFFIGDAVGDQNVVEAFKRREELQHQYSERYQDLHIQLHAADAKWSQLLADQSERIAAAQANCAALDQPGQSQTQSPTAPPAATAHPLNPQSQSRLPGRVSVQKKIVFKQLLFPPVPRPSATSGDDPLGEQRPTMRMSEVVKRLGEQDADRGAPPKTSASKPVASDPFQAKDDLLRTPGAVDRRPADLAIGGTRSTARVRFLRLEYTGGDWDQDLKLNGDLNLLAKFRVQTGIQVAEQPESIEVDRLRNFTTAGAPPLVYLTGSKLIVLEKHEVKTLRDYLLDNHGLLLLDNGGGAFHQQAFAMMKQVVREIEPVKVPLDDPIHAQPNEVRGLPLVSPHGGRDAYGWKHKGRWICYYHPGDLGDAWSDGHAGVPKDVWQACYDLGVNIMHYAYAEQSKWRGEQGIK